MQKREPEYENIVDNIINCIEKNQDEDGYFNSYIQTIGENRRFKKRNEHELYCLGHLIEAAIAYHEATGKDKLLKCVMKYCDYVEKVFIIENSADFVTPGHQEVELALIKLYRYTKNEKYLKMAQFFLEARANNDKDSHEEALPEHQSDMRIREITEAVGHAVRANYQYSAMAALAKEISDKELEASCDRIIDNIVNKKMSITAGVGAKRYGEAFSYEYDLPNLTAYNETCASIGLAYFCAEMQQLKPNSLYGDIIERAIYNGIISGISLSGDEFFYENPLEINLEKTKMEETKMAVTTRQKLFMCSCCPPNLVRFIPSISRYIYTVHDDKIYCNQFISSKAELLVGGESATITQKSLFPNNGKVIIEYHGKPTVIAVRVPGWFTGETDKTEEGFAEFNVTEGSIIELDFTMKPIVIEANPNVQECAGKCAIMRGPLVYCLEGIDNGKNLRDIVIEDDFKEEFNSDFRAFTLTTNAYRRAESKLLYYPKTNEKINFTARLIPYYAFANRGGSDMLVWVRVL